MSISRKIRAARRRAAHTSAPATISTDILAQLSARLDESLNRMAFYRNLQNEKNAHFAQLPLNQQDTCKNTISEPLSEPQPS